MKHLLYETVFIILVILMANQTYTKMLRSFKIRLPLLSEFFFFYSMFLIMTQVSKVALVLVKR